MTPFHVLWSLFEETPCPNMVAKNSPCAREGYLKKVGVQTFKKGGMLRVEAMFCPNINAEQAKASSASFHNSK